MKDRRLYPTWGPKKLRDLLLKKHGIGRPPSCSTIGAILKRNGTIIPVESKAEPFESVEGVIKVPSGSGLGLTIDPDYIATHKLAEA